MQFTLDELKTIMKTMEEHGVTELTLGATTGAQVNLKRTPPQTIVNPAPIPTISHINPPVYHQTQSPSPMAPIAENKSQNFIKSPLIGSFYTRSAPDKAPYIKVGDTVTKGQIVCIIEAMKVMNEIKSPVSGTVEEILLKDGDAAHYDTPLFRLT